MRRLSWIIAALAALSFTVAAPLAAQAVTKPAPALTWYDQNGQDITASGYTFGPLGPGERQQAETFTVTNTGTAATGALRATTLNQGDSTAFAIVTDSCAGISLGPNESCTVTVQFSSDMAASATLTVSSRKITSTLSLTGLAAVAPPVLGWYYDQAGTVPVGDSFVFQPVQPGSTATVQIQLVNTGGSATGTLTLKGTSSGTSESFFSYDLSQCQGTSLGAGQSCAVTIDYNAVAPGETTGQLDASGASGGSASLQLTATTSAP